MLNSTNPNGDLSVGILAGMITQAPASSEYSSLEPELPYVLSMGASYLSKSVLSTLDEISTRL